LLKSKKILKNFKKNPKIPRFFLIHKVHPLIDKGFQGFEMGLLGINKSCYLNIIQEVIQFVRWSE